MRGFGLDQCDRGGVQVRYRVIDDISPDTGALISPGSEAHPRYLTTDEIALLANRPVEAIIATLVWYRAIVEDPEPDAPTPEPVQPAPEPTPEPSPEGV